MDDLLLQLLKDAGRDGITDHQLIAFGFRKRLLREALRRLQAHNGVVAGYYSTKPINGVTVSTYRHAAYDPAKRESVHDA